MVVNAMGSGRKMGSLEEKLAGLDSIAVLLYVQFEDI
jgi:hypothetical protein